MTIQELKKLDAVRITGIAISQTHTVHVVDLVGLVMALSPPDPECCYWAVKIWPENHRHPGLPNTHNGKLWFMEDTITKLELLDREEAD